MLRTRLLPGTVLNQCTLLFQAEELKERKKEEKKVLKAQAKAAAISGAEPGSDGEEDAAEGAHAEEEVTVGEAENAFLGISTVPSSSARTSAKGKAKAAPVVEVEEPEEVPLLLNPDWPHLGAVLNDADVFVQILDAREPLAFRSAQIERLAEEKGKKMLFVLNKIGLYALHPCYPRSRSDLCRRLP